MEEIPTNVIDLFKWGSDPSVIDQAKYKPRQIASLFVIRHQDGWLTYCAEVKSMGPHSETENVFVDIIGNDVVGYSEMLQKEFSMIKPSVGYTETREGFRRRGLGTRRLLTMNAFSRAYFGMPLHSADMGDSQPEAIAIWEKLVKERKAKKFKEGGFDRYVMLI